MSKICTLKKIFTAIGLTAATACSHGASMRVEVEVYKGPLSKTVAVQEEELCAKIVDAERTFGHLYASLTRKEHNSGHKSARPRKHGCKTELLRSSSPHRLLRTDCRLSNANTLAALTNTKGGLTISRSNLNADICWAENAATVVLNNWRTTDTPMPPNKPSDSQSNNKRENFARAAQLGAQLRDRASYWASAQAATPEQDEELRVDINNFAQFLAEIGNQIVSRSDALLMQDERLRGRYRDYFNNKGLQQLSAAQRLATSLYLRDSNTTAFQNLHDWNRNRNALDRFGEADRLDRVRMVEELMRDTHWSNVNTVQANGMGETRMAFIKDDIGNWNLKSFTSDPEELLAAYNNLARGVVSEAFTMATTSGVGNVAKADKLMSFANRALIGKPESSEPTLGTANVSALRARIKERLESEDAQLDEKLEKPKADLDLAKTKRKEETEKQEATVAATKESQGQIDGIEKTELSITQDDRTSVCGPALAATTVEPGSNFEKLKTPCQKLHIDLAAEKAIKTKIANLDAEIAKQQDAIKKLELASIKNARGILRDHTIIIGTLEEVLNPPEEKDKPDSDG